MVNFWKAKDTHYTLSLFPVRNPPPPSLPDIINYSPSSLNPATQTNHPSSFEGQPFTGQVRACVVSQRGHCQGPIQWKGEASTPNSPASTPNSPASTTKHSNCIVQITLEKALLECQNRPCMNGLKWPHIT